MTKYLFWPLAVVLLLAGCGAEPVPEHPADAHEAGLHQDAGDDHAHGHAGGIAVTSFDAATELFVEYPPLVRAEAAAFAAHLSWTGARFTAVNEGTLSVTLNEGQSEVRAEAEVSTTPGIFRPVLTPSAVGRQRLRLILTVGDRVYAHDLGEVMVYADAAAAAKAQGAEGAAVGNISFTKEQQWKLDFAHVPVTERELRETVASSGALRPVASHEAVISSPAAGVLDGTASDFPQIGMTVERGQVLMTLMPRLATGVDVATLEADLQRARAHHQHTAQTARRLRGLVDAEAIAASRAVEAEHEFEVAKTDMHAAERRLGMLRGEGGGVPLRAPVSGTIVEVRATRGSSVEEGQLLVHIADLRQLWLEADIAETDLGRITTPTGVYFQLNGAATTVLTVGSNARLVSFGGLVDAQTRTVGAIFEFDNDDGALRAGMRFAAHVFTGEVRHMPAVPASAVIDDNGQNVVFVMKDGETFERRMVRTAMRDGDWLGIEAGLQVGERVVSAGAYQVRLAAQAPAAMGHGHAH